LQDLNSDLSKYFRNSRLSDIVLYGPKAQVPCKLLIKAKFVKIGSGWKRFCDLHGLEARYIVIFEVDGEHTNKDVNVLFNINENYHHDRKHP